MKLSQIETFIAVAETGSIGGAALRLKLTQPAVTRQIQQLEKELDATLLDRRSKPPTLTPAGRRALNHCRCLIKTMDDLRGSVSEAAQPTGNLRLGVAFGATEIALSEPIDILRHTYPQLKIEVVTNWSGKLMQKTKIGDVDAAVVLTAEDRQPSSELNGHPIGSSQILVAAARNASLDQDASMSALATFDWVLNPQGCWYRDRLYDAFARNNMPLNVVIETFGIEFQLSLVARGVGLGLVPTWAIKRSQFRENIKLLRLAEFQFGLTVWSIRTHYLGHLGIAIETLENAIAKNL